MSQNHKSKIKELARIANKNYGHLVFEAQVNHVLVNYSEASPKEARRAVKAIIRENQKAQGINEPIRTLANR